MISRKDLAEYNDTVEYLNELRDRKSRYVRKITNLEKRIEQIECGEIVKDSVKGGEGGIQTFKIEGYPSEEYESKRTSLMLTKLKLEELCSILDDEEEAMMEKANEVERFMSNIDNTRIKRIINLRCVDGFSWTEVSDFIGGNSTADSVRMEFNRFVKNS